MKTYLEQYYSPDRFVKLEDGWKRDHFLSLEWSPSSTETKDWATGMQWCKKIYGRGPSFEELVTLINYRSERLIFPEFEDTKSGSYWSSTTYPLSTGNALFVGFSYGLVLTNDKTRSYYVRAVRNITDIKPRKEK